MSTVVEQLAERLHAAYRDVEPSVLLERLIEITLEAENAGVDPMLMRLRLAAWARHFPSGRDKWAAADEALADLCVKLMAPSPRPKFKFRVRLSKRIAWVFDHYVAAAGLAVAAASALYGLAYADFYGELNTTPERVGLSTSQILLHSATGGLALTVLIWLGLFLVFLPFVPIRDDPQAANETGSTAAFTGYCIMCLISIAALIWLVISLEAPLWMASAVGVQIIIVAEESASFGRKGFHLTVKPKPMDFGLERFLVLTVVVLPLAILATGVLTVVHADQLGEDARNGEAVRDPHILEMPFLGVRAEPAMISWNGTAGRDPDIPECALYLGASDGQVILYDPRSAATIELPSGAIHLHLRRYRSSCAAPVNTRLPRIHPLSKGRLSCGKGAWKPSDVKYSYEWFVNDDSAAEQQVVDATEILPDSILRCQVTAATALGSDSAASVDAIAPVKPRRAEPESAQPRPPRARARS
jgi:hypothetical protein